MLGLIGIGALSLGVVPPEELEATKPQLELNQSGNNLHIDWSAHPEVFYFFEGTNDLTLGEWETGKLLKGNSESGGLSVVPQITGDKGFYRLNLEGDPGAARLREDSDGDGIINLLEVEAGWDAYVAEDATDSDSDGIPDYFEQFHFGTLEHDASYVAVAGGLTLGEAFANATEPNSADSDGDGFSDAQEISWGWDPNYDQSRDDLKYGLEGDFDGDGLTNAQEAALGLNPTSTDTDGDGVDDSQEDYDNDNVVNVNDAVPDDGEINWEKAPESRYVWLPQVERTGARAVSRHGHILFTTGGTTGSNGEASGFLWDSMTSGYIELTGNSTWSGSGLVTLDPSGDYAPFWENILNMSDDGIVVGQSTTFVLESGFNYPDSALMLWEMTGSETDQYGSPTYLVPSSEYIDYNGDGDADSLPEMLWLYTGPTIADDGTVSSESYRFADDEIPDEQMAWVVKKTSAGNHSSEMNKWLTVDDPYFGRTEAILDEQTGLFVRRDSTNDEEIIYFRDGGDPESLDGLLSNSNDSDINDTDISRTPVPVGATTGRIWFSVNHDGGDDVYIEKRDGGSGVDRWHKPDSMDEGAIRLNALGEAITETKVWRNGFYTPINDLVSKPEGSDLNITKLIDLASNGIILAEATEGGVTKTGLLLKVDMEWISKDEANNPIDENPNEGGGKRYYPGKRLPTESDPRNLITLKVSVPGLAGKKVRLKAFDVDDPTEDIAPYYQADGVDQNQDSGDDNFDDYLSTPKTGAFHQNGVTYVATVVTLDSDGEAEIDFQVGMQPGNNYRVVATLWDHQGNFDQLQVDDASADTFVSADDELISGFTGAGAASSMLTVWRKLHIEQDSMEAVPTSGSEKNFEEGTITGTTTVEILPGVFGATLDLSGSFGSYEVDEFVKGRIEIDGEPIYASGGAAYGIPHYEITDFDNNGTVTVRPAPGASVIGKDLKLFDDDERGLPSSHQPLLPRYDLINGTVKSKFEPAYITVVDADTLGLNPNKTVPFEKNMTLNNLLPNVGNNAEDLTEYAEDEAFWNLLVTACYQGDTTSDQDPDANGPAVEGALLENGIKGVGLTPAFTVIFLEGIREDAFELNSRTDAIVSAGQSKFLQRIPIIVSHEIGHAPGDKDAEGEHAEGGLMSDGAIGGWEFTDESIKRFREADSWR